MHFVVSVNYTWAVLRGVLLISSLAIRVISSAVARRVACRAGCFFKDLAPCMAISRRHLRVSRRKQETRVFGVLWERATGL